MKFTKELKDTWIAALRLGDYKQGHSSLRNADNKFCCLGVLADIIDPEGWEQKSPDECYTFKNYSRGVIEKEDINLDINQSHFVTLNDGDRLSFNEIANYIEGNVKCTE